MLEVSLDPVRAPIEFVPGQFVFLAFGGPDGWQRHPFSVASAPGDRRLEVAIKAVGDYTRRLRDEIRSGDAAKVAGPFGGFDYKRGGKEQIWIAGGIGITPFMSWIRSFDDSFDRDVAFFYSVAHESDAVYLDEIEQAGQEHPTFVPHVVVADRDGFLTAEKAAAGRNVADVWVYMYKAAGAARPLGDPRTRRRRQSPGTPQGLSRARGSVRLAPRDSRLAAEPGHSRDQHARPAAPHPPTRPRSGRSRHPLHGPSRSSD
jgi:ferredoxin-NADP reductase